MLDYNLDNRGEASLYEYLYQCICTDIKDGAIAAHERMPSKRALAQHLGVSVITVENAYAQLVAEGYLYTKPRSGFYASSLPDTQVRHGNSLNKEPFVSEAFAPSTKEIAEDRETQPGVSQEAARLWSRALRAVLTTEPDAELYAPAPAEGTLRLRVAIASHLRQTRGMVVSPKNIVVGAGAQLLDIMLVQLLGAAKKWAVEDPGYVRLTSLYQAAGASVEHISLDAHGINIDELVASSADVLHVMPSHQFPTGTVMSIARRYELLAWASAQAGRYIIEDDYDCEFRLSGKPIPSLQSIDTTGRVIYTNTFSKSLSSALRLAYMVLPNELMEHYHANLGFYSSTLSTVQQVTLARLLESGDYERHVNRMRKIARDKRDMLLNLLEHSYGDQISVEASDAGLHFVVACTPECDIPELQSLLINDGAKVGPLASFAWNPQHAKSADGRTRLVVQF